MNVASCLVRLPLRVSLHSYSLGYPICPSCVKLKQMLMGAGTDFTTIKSPVPPAVQHELPPSLHQSSSFVGEDESDDVSDEYPMGFDDTPHERIVLAPTAPAPRGGPVGRQRVGHENGLGKHTTSAPKT